MFYKKINEEGDYIDNVTGCSVNVISGLEIFTPEGKVTQDNLCGYNWFDTEEEMMIEFNLSKKINI